MSDIALNPTTGDVDVLNGEIRLVSGIDAIVQSLRIRYRTFLGEWFLDTSVGVPWFQLVFVKNPNLALLRGVLREVATRTPGVASVRDFSLTVSNARECSISFVALTSSGETVPFTFADLLSGIPESALTLDGEYLTLD